MSASPFAEALNGDLAMRTARYDLRPLTGADASELFGLLSDPGVVEFMDIEQPTEIAHVLAIVAWTEAIRARGEGARWAVRERSTGTLVGTCGLHALVWERGFRGEVGYDVGRPFWGQRVMAEALPAVLAFGFGALGLRRIEAMVTAGNDPSRRLLERHGFQLEGTLRDYAFWKGHFCDQLLYARLAA